MSHSVRVEFIVFEVYELFVVKFSKSNFCCPSDVATDHTLADEIHNVNDEASADGSARLLIEDIPDQTVHIDKRLRAAGDAAKGLQRSSWTPDLAVVKLDRPLVW
jgi:hypothetical protein